MTDLNFIILTFLGALIVFLLLRNSVQKVNMIQYPFLATATVMGWVFPQFLGIYINETVPSDALTLTMIYTAMCLIATVLGYAAAKRPSRAVAWRFSPQRLDMAALGLMAFGIYFYLKYTSMAADATAMYGGFWTGEITIYVFLASAFKYGFIVATVANIQRPSTINRLLIAIGTITFLNTAIFMGRRQDSVELFVILLWFLWLKRGWLPPRTVVIGALLAGMLFVNTISTYRNVVVNATGDSQSETTLAELAEIDFVDLFVSNVKNADSNYELTNASYTIAAANARAAFDGGLSFWNSLVQNFVPGQIIGHNVKLAMMADLEDVAFTEYKHIGVPGATSTGMADSFRSYWFFGVFVFFIIGYIMKRFYLGVLAGSYLSVVATMFFMAQALLAYTHLTHLFFTSFVNFAVFVLPALRYAKLSDRVR